MPKKAYNLKLKLRMTKNQYNLQGQFAILKLNKHFKKSATELEIIKTALFNLKKRMLKRVT